MKCIYATVFIIIACATAVFSQSRMIDVSLKHYYEIAAPGQTQPSTNVSEIIDGTHILLNKNCKIFLSFKIFNMSTIPSDSVDVTDTLHIVGTETNIVSSGISIRSSSRSPILYDLSMPMAIASIPSSNIIDWCDSVWVTSQVGSTNPVFEINTADNITCNSIVVDYWPADVDDIKTDSNGFMVFPNPSNGNMSIVYNFGNNNSGVITIVDVTGKVVYTQQLDANLRGIQTIKVHTQGLATGLYSLRFATGNKVVVEKIYINN